MSILVLGLVVGAILTIGVQDRLATGSIAGCLSDVRGQRLPGAAVVLKGGSVQRTTGTDSSGCYEAKDLPPGSYRVTARPAGFGNVTRNKIAVTAGAATRLDFAIRVAPVCECVRITGTLAEHLAYADAVFHVRISDDEPDGSDPQGYYPHRAIVIAAVNPPARGAQAGIVLLQNQRSGALPVFDVGQELIVFLKASGPDAFFITNDEPGLATAGEPYPMMALVVQKGHIVQAPAELARYVGTPSETFLQELRALLRRRQEAP